MCMEKIIGIRMGRKFKNDLVDYKYSFCLNVEENIRFEKLLVDLGVGNFMLFIKKFIFLG